MTLLHKYYVGQAKSGSFVCNNATALEINIATPCSVGILFGLVLTERSGVWTESWTRYSQLSEMAIMIYDVHKRLTRLSFCRGSTIICSLKILKISTNHKNSEK